jgi:Tfp pilus assembly protein PilV
MITLSKLLKNQQGIGLVEVLAALGISVIAITALVSLSIYTIRISLQNKLELMGSQRATRERELVRAFRDKSTSWEQFLTDLNSAGCTTRCHIEQPTSDTFAPVSGSASESVEGSVVLTRSFTIAPDPNNTSDNNIRLVTITVSWSIAGVTHTTHLYTYLSNWKNDL